MADIYMGLEEFKRLLGNNANKFANDLDVCADMAETEDLEIKCQNLASYLRQFADEELFSQTPKYEGNVIAFEEHYKRRG